MEVLLSVNLYPRLIGFVSQRISHFISEHHHRAVHEIVHNVLQSWNARLRVNHIEINPFISDNLNSPIASGEVDGTSSLIKSMVFLPLALFVYFEKQNRVRGPCHNSFLEQHVNRSEVGFGDLLDADL